MHVVKSQAVPLAVVITFLILVPATYYMGLVKKAQAAPLVILVAFSLFVYITYYISKRGKDWYIRPIEALTIIDEGIGRAAEMGKPVLTTPGMGGLSGAVTLAGLSITGEVIQRTAELGVRSVNITDSAQTMMVLEAIVRNAYSTAGRSDLYQPGRYVQWTGGEQFAYATYMMGSILTEKPATIIFVGSFLSDIMMSAETGKRVGAIEIGGTLDTTALSTMAMICDSILVGEEIYAAAAVITKDKQLSGSVAGQDWALLVTLVLLVVGMVASLVGVKDIINLLKM